MNIPHTVPLVLPAGHGGPEKPEFREDVPVPAPAGDEVLVRVGACGMNNTEIRVREGVYGSGEDPDEVSGFRDGPLNIPRIRGADIVGKVVSTGADADPSLIGNRVMIDFGIHGDTDENAANYEYIGHARDAVSRRMWQCKLKTLTPSTAAIPTPNLRLSAAPASRPKAC
jgi:NADPH:quinone reductase-like Zn-dependent oxidoreductase